MLEIRLLGRFELCFDGEQIEISSRPACTLLAYLVLTRGTTHPREKLAGLLWPESSEENARKNLRQALWRLRKIIGDRYLRVDPQSLAFNATSDFWLDVVALEGENGQDLALAISTYEGELLPGFYDDWVLLERDRLHAVFERRMHQYIQQLVQEERWMDVLEWSEHWIAQGQTPEAAYRALMRAYAGMGELSKVDAVYHRCTDALQQELGVNPSKETNRLYERIVAGEALSPVRIPQKMQDISTTTTGQLILPAQSTSFIGRVEELKQIKELLANSHLLTITGPGGIGKTRLAIRAAVESAPEFEHGCFFVPFAPIQEVDHIIQTIAETLNFPIATHEDPKHQLLRFLMPRQLLLLMDNFEHLLDGVEVINHILQAAPQVKILVTSREKLNLQSETNFVLGGMGYPAQSDAEVVERFDAISLFLQTAGRVRPGFAPSSKQLEQISRICQIVGGMPLAIELAGAWLHVLDVGEIVEELGRGFSLLETDKRDAPERHRSIHAIFDQSWSLLDPQERDVFTKLSVFRGGFTREAAHQVTGASLHQLAGLVNKSFLIHIPEASRFELHELLRQYGQQQLEEWPEHRALLLDEYAAYYAEFMDERAMLLRGKKQKAVLGEIVADIENVRAAWRYYLKQGNSRKLWKFVTGLWHVYWIRWWNYAGWELFAEAANALSIAEDEDAVAIRGLVIAFQSYFMAWLGLADQGYELAKESVEILKRFNHPEALVFAYDSLIVNAYMLGRMSEEGDASKNMLEIAAEVNDPWLSAFGMFAAGMDALIKGSYAEAQQLGMTNLKLYEEIGDVSGSTMPLIVLGHRALVQGEFDEARNYYQRCLAIAEDIGFHYSSQTASKYLGNLSISTGDLEQADFYLQKSLTITNEIGFLRDIINLIYEFARLRVEQGEVEQAVELLALVVQHPASDQIRWLEGSIRKSATALLSKLEADLVPEIINAAKQRGQSVELQQVVARLLD